MDCTSAGLGQLVFQDGNIPANIAKIDLRRNNISSLPSDNFTVINNVVKEINFESNYIEMIDGDAVGQAFPMLNKLSFFQNKIRKIRKLDFRFMIRLKHLDLGENLIRAVEDQAFKKLKNLEKLYLDGNFLGSFSRLSFDGIRNLKVLKLNNNKLTTIEHEWINHLDALEKLFANSNKIGLIRPLNAAWQKSLMILDLSDNKMKYIPSLPSLKNTHSNMTFGKDWYIDLQRNPVQCSCFHSSLQDYTLADLEKVVCGLSVQYQCANSIIKWNSGDKCNANQRLKIMKNLLQKPVCQEPLLELRSFEVIANKVYLIHLQCTASGEPIPKVKIVQHSNETVSVQQNFSIATLYIKKIVGQQLSAYKCVATNEIGFSKSSDWESELSPIGSKNNTILEKAETKNKLTELVKDKLDFHSQFQYCV